MSSYHSASENVLQIFLQLVSLNSSGNSTGNYKEIKRSHHGVGCIKIAEEPQASSGHISSIHERNGEPRFRDCCGKTKDARNCERNDEVDGTIFSCCGISSDLLVYIFFSVLIVVFEE